MSFRIRYVPLATVTLHHGFHLNGKAGNGRAEFESFSADEKRRRLDRYNLFQDMSLEVPAETQGLLQDFRCIVKRTRSGFVVATQVNPDSLKPLRQPDRAFRLRFHLSSRSSAFWNYTNVATGRGESKVHHLTNFAKQKVGAKLCLSRQERVHQPGRRYTVGDVVRDSGHLFLALQTGVGSLPTGEDADNAFWLRLAGKNYVSESDLVVVWPKRFAIPLAQRWKTLGSIELADESGKVRSLQKPELDETFESVSVDASDVAGGRYSLTVKGVNADGSATTFEKDIYLDDEIRARSVFAAIDISHVPGGSLGEFGLYDDSFTLLQPKFYARLLNRHTFWRYRFRNPPTGPFKDIVQVNDQFVANRVMPLTQSLQRIELFDGKALPNAKPDRVIPTEQSVYSDVHVHVTPTNET